MNEQVLGGRTQLGLDLAHSPRPARRVPRPCNRERAEWWFQQMHKVIDLEPAPAVANPRPRRLASVRG